MNSQSSQSNTLLQQINLRQVRLALNMTQKDFLHEFLSDNDEKILMSVSTFSNIELKGGRRLDEIISAVSRKLSLNPEIFSLENKDFNDRLSEHKIIENFSGSHEDSSCRKNKNKKNCRVKEILNLLTMYFADQIMEGKLKKGEQIPSDRELAKKLGVGRSVVREALKVLDVMGMIDIRPGQGTYLANSKTNFFSIPLSWSLFLDGGQVQNIIAVRSILETKSAELAANCTDEILLHKLDKVFHGMTLRYEDMDYEKFIDYDIEFHSCIAECSKNPVIYSMLQTIRNFLRRLSGSGMADEKQMQEIYSEHRKIYGSIISHNEAFAVKYMQEHVEHAGKRYNLEV